MNNQICIFHLNGDCYDLKLHEVADNVSPDRTVIYVCSNHIRKIIKDWDPKCCGCNLCGVTVF